MAKQLRYYRVFGQWSTFFLAIDLISYSVNAAACTYLCMWSRIRWLARRTICIIGRHQQSSPSAASRILPFSTHHTMTEQEESNQARETGEQPRGMHRGWWIVVASGVFHGLFGGLYHTGISVYFLPLIRDFQISRTTLSLAFSLRTLEGGIEGPLAGYMVDRFGPRSVIVFGVIVGGLGFMLLAATRSYPMFLLVFLGLLTVGFSTPFHGMAYSINQWFRRRLGIAMSLAAAGSAIGGFLLTPAVAWVVLNDDLGWRWAAVISGLILLIVGPPLAIAYRKPTEAEAAADEAPPVRAGATAAEPTPVYPAVTPREAPATRPPRQRARARRQRTRPRQCGLERRLRRRPPCTRSSR